MFNVTTAQATLCDQYGGPDQKDIVLFNSNLQ